jgi:AAA-like domain/PEGA domain
MPETLPASFFVVGGTLRRDAPSYIERAADQLLYHALQAGEICYLLTARQMGKSSLMVRTAARLRENGARVAVLDLTSLGQNLTAEQWYNGLVERAGQQFRLEDEVEDCWRRFPQLGPMRRFMRVISDAILPVREDRIVIFVDEIDAVRSLPFSTDEFFAGIRECFNRRSSDPEIERLTFCLLGVATPSDLIRDTRTTPFNIGRRIELTDFTEQEAMPLVQGLGTDDGVGSAILRRIVYWTGGHPYLTQRLCQAVAQESTVRNVSAVDRLCRELFLSNRARDRDDNLLFVRERLLRSEVDTPGLLTVYERILDGKAVRDDETNPLISVLRLSGITRVENGVLKLRSRIYKEVFNQDWVISNMPGAELRRQRTAYKRGLKRAFAVMLPLILLGMLIAYRNLYLARNTMALLHFKSPSPPAFWASSRIPVAGEQSQIGGILLRTGQPDVTVLVDDIQFGRTSSSGDLRIPLPPASYNISLEKPGFRPMATSVLVAKNSETPISVKLEREVAPSFVVTGGVPGATVRFDGKEVGVVKPDGTFAHEASPGKHAIALEKTGYLPVQGEMTLTLGATTSIEVKMQPDTETSEAADYAVVADSADPSALLQYLRKYPNSKRTAQVLARLEDLDWKKVSRTDLTSLDAFLQAHPQGQHANEARRVVEELQREQGDFIAAVKAGTTEALQAYLNRHPNSQYSEQVRQKLSQQLDKEAVLSVLHRYEDSYNRKDLESIVDLWPSCPERYKKAYRDSFRSTEPQKLKLELGEPDIQGNFASVPGKGTRSGALNASAPFTATLVRQGDKWVIQSGIF